MKPIRVPDLAPEQLIELEELYRSTRSVRLRTRAQKMVLLAAERGLTAREIAEIVRSSEETVRRWLKRYLVEGVEGLSDAPQPGAPRKVTEDYRERLVQAVRRRPRSLGLAFSLWTLRRLADYMAEQTGHTGGVRDGEGASEGSRYRTQSSAAHHHESGSRVCPQKKAIEETRNSLGAGDHFYYADEFNLSWMPTLKAIWAPKGQQVMIPTPAQPKKRYGIGAVDYHTGETVVLIRRRKRRREIAELLEALLEKHPTGKIYVAWDNSNTHEDEEVEAVLRGAAGRLVVL
jgi:transposase